jgi:hypothetical protein
VLHGVEPEIRDVGRLLMAMDPEDTAFVVEVVGLVLEPKGLHLSG